MAGDSSAMLARLRELIARHDIRIDPWLVQALLSRGDELMSYRLRLRGKFSLLFYFEPAAKRMLDSQPELVSHWLGRFEASGIRLKILSADGSSVHALADVDEVKLDSVQALLEDIPFATFRQVEIARPVIVSSPPNGEELPSEPILPTARAQPTDGRGVVIGVVDYGFDFLHRSLRSENETRLLALWDQNGKIAPPPGPMQVQHLPALLLSNGTEFGAASINEWIKGFRNRLGGADEAQATSEMRRLTYERERGYNPFSNYYAPELLSGPNHGLHGTHVTSIAAGSKVEEFSGIAPGAGIIAVQLGIAGGDWAESGPSGGGPWPGGLPEENNHSRWRQYSDIAHLVNAVKYVVYRALSPLDPATPQPNGIVVNLSLGTFGGAHDGRSFFESEMDAFIQDFEEQRWSRPAGELPMLAIVCCAGNAGNSENHIHATLKPSAALAQPFVFDWVVTADDFTNNELEIWYAPEAAVEVTLVPPAALIPAGAQPAPRFAIPHDSLRTFSLGGPVFGCGTHLSGGNGTHPRPTQVNLLLDPKAVPQAAPGTKQRWRVELRLVTAQAPVEVHAWIERDDRSPSTLSVSAGNGHPVNEINTTLSSLCCGAHTIVIGACGPPDGNDRFGSAEFSSQGPRPWQAVGAPIAIKDDPLRPHICAQGKLVNGAHGGTAMGTVAMNGTSQATPQVAGAIARMMQKAAPFETDGPPRQRFVTADFVRALQQAARASRAAKLLPMVFDRPDKDWDSRYGTGPLDVEGAIAALLAVGPSKR